jgi:acyl-coenzyme A thioesterase PaaI-like protein
MPESWKTRVTRWYFNLLPTYRGSGGRIRYVAADWCEVRIDLPLSWRTRNYVGTIFGGSMFAAVDPIYMVMLINILGPGYVVWDKSATIRFLKPGRSTLRAHFELDEAEIQEIKDLVREGPAVNRVYRVDLVDREGTVCAAVEKTIHIRRK